MINVVYSSSVEGHRATANGRVVGVVFAPVHNGGDYWIRNEATAVVRKGFATLDAAKAALTSDVLASITAHERHLQVAVVAVQSRQYEPPSRLYPSSAKDVRQQPPKPQAKIVSRPVAPPMIECPLCHAQIKHVAKHFRKQHPESLQRVAKSEALPETVAARAASEYLRNQIRNKAQLPTWVRKVLVGIRPAGNTLIRCPKCSKTIRERVFERHLLTAHVERGGTTKKKRRKSRGHNSGTRNRAVRSPAFRHPEHDVTKDYAHSFRERGRFGSHASHDGFGDDDRA